MRTQREKTKMDGVLEKRMKRWIRIDLRREWEDG